MNKYGLFAACAFARARVAAVVGNAALEAKEMAEAVQLARCSGNTNPEVSAFIADKPCLVEAFIEGQRDMDAIIARGITVWLAKEWTRSECGYYETRAVVNHFGDSFRGGWMESLHGSNAEYSWGPLTQSAELAEADAKRMATVKLAEFEVQRMANEAANSCGSSHDYYGTMFSNMVDEWMGDETERECAVEIAVRFGYLNSTERVSMRESQAESGLCFHGLDSRTCPSGCFEY